MAGGAPGPDTPDRAGPARPRPAPLLAASLLGFLLGLYALLYAALLFSAARLDGVLAVIAAVYLGISVLCVAGRLPPPVGRGSPLLAAGGVGVAALSVRGHPSSLTRG